MGTHWFAQDFIDGESICWLMRESQRSGLLFLGDLCSWACEYIFSDVVTTNNKTTNAVFITEPFLFIFIILFLFFQSVKIFYINYNIL